MGVTKNFLKRLAAYKQLVDGYKADVDRTGDPMLMYRYVATVHFLFNMREVMERRLKNDPKIDPKALADLNQKLAAIMDHAYQIFQDSDDPTGLHDPTRLKAHDALLQKARASLIFMLGEEGIDPIIMPPLSRAVPPEVPLLFKSDSQLREVVYHTKGGKMDGGMTQERPQDKLAPDEIALEDQVPAAKPVGTFHKPKAGAPIMMESKRKYRDERPLSPDEKQLQKEIDELKDLMTIARTQKDGELYAELRARVVIKTNELDTLLEEPTQKRGLVTVDYQSGGAGRKDAEDSDDEDDIQPKLKVKGTPMPPRRNEKGNKNTPDFD